MASAAGARAKGALAVPAREFESAVLAGTDGTDFKFRQRVDDYYTLMAEAKKTLKSVRNCQLLLFLAVLGVNAVQYTTSPDALLDQAVPAGIACLLPLAGAWQAKGTASNASKAKAAAVRPALPPIAAADGCVLGV